MSGVACSLCGRGADAATEGDPPLAWATEVDAGRTRWICPECTRRHVRSIEAKLDQEWW